MIKINPICKKIYKKIKKYDQIVIARHIGPDPDAVAGQMALRDSIKKTFPNKKVYAVGLGVAKYRYYGQLDRINESELINPLLIVLDLPDLKRVDGVNQIYYKDIVKMDHHPFEQKMGEVEWIDEQACSTCELIAQLIFDTKLILDDKIGGYLYLGIASDSERFLFNNSTSKTFAVVSELLKRCNLDLKSLYDYLYERPLLELRFQGFIAENLVVNEYGFAYLKITPEDIKKHSVDVATAFNMINSFNYIKDYVVWVFVTYDEANDLYKTSIRSRGPIINEIANKYNGGGHQFAAGCRIKEKNDVELLLKDLENITKDYWETFNENKKI